MNITATQIPVKAIGLMSGGLDSLLAAKILKDLGVHVTILHFLLPWMEGPSRRLTQGAETVGVGLICCPLDQRFIDMIQNPPHGYGSAMNPCIDCKIHMLRRAKEYMEANQADIVFTGEVLGQRPMSQNKLALDIIERESGLEGRLLRPLSAKRLPPTLVEQENRIDRDRLLSIEGRSRTMQIQLAQQFGITDFAQPAGGCLLTEKSFESRLRDLFGHNYQKPDDLKILKPGRHFRIDPHFKIILGRDENENISLEKLAAPDDIFLRLETAMGPVAVLQGQHPAMETIATAAGLVQYFSKFKNNPPQNIVYWIKSKGESDIKKIPAKKVGAGDIDGWKI